MMSLLLILAAQACPLKVDPVVCQTHDACVDRLLRTRTASIGVSVREAQLVARLDAERACALSARAEHHFANVALQACLRTDQLCPDPPALPEPVCAEFATAALSSVVACAVCAGGVGITIGLLK